MEKGWRRGEEEMERGLQMVLRGIERGWKNGTEKGLLARKGDRRRTGEGVGKGI